MRSWKMVHLSVNDTSNSHSMFELVILASHCLNTKCDWTEMNLFTSSNECFETYCLYRRWSGIAWKARTIVNSRWSFTFWLHPWGKIEMGKKVKKKIIKCLDKRCTIYNHQWLSTAVKTKFCLVIKIGIYLPWKSIRNIESFDEMELPTKKNVFIEWRTKRKINKKKYKIIMWTLNISTVT